MNETNLFEEFIPSYKEDWLGRVKADLKGKPLKSLNWVSNGLHFTPFYHRDDIKTKYLPLNQNRTDNSWKPGVVVRGNSLSEVNARAIEMLELGATVLRFLISTDFNAEELGTLLSDIQLEWISTEFQLSQGVDVQSFIKAFINFCSNSKFDISKVNGGIFSDEGKAAVSLEDLSRYKNNLPNFRWVTVSSNKENFVEELGDILLELYEVIHSYNGMSLSEILETVTVEMTVNDEYYASIAKLRALRLLLAHMLDAYVSPSPDLPVIAVIPTLDTASDANTNRIKRTTQLSAAIIGGGDIIYSASIKSASALDQRIAQNTHNLLSMESFLDRVIDPVAGSYFFESMTNQICEASWKYFQDSFRKTNS